ncbi:carcinoembryonic antigen-related cell adhesion molecule 19-like [Pantherophis guttatus]|uniref:Carcinoembryonic antigen-related cell adhesion molecule 19-like n=1 Tax=Pantherophis guttatus TaxID=94885 RepID=A0ABM3ZN71_PANGU|nr:carcinoembryonic antigen-related cell adhesion molecule 19-like [Pantherophis guttatus]XP_060549824.1 carcinoembryonic antigen-related cell adhesion molecule 19-like [Pantherophis guttatus]XP_060549825.1 carcinoembryonic antigen-related cell adhesion molecule 19-like [Pantherophis guttatus]
MPTEKMEVFYKHLSLRVSFLALWIILVQASRINIVSIPETPAEGQNVTFSVERVQGDIREVNWFRGMASQGSSRIFSFFPGNYRPQRNGVQFTNREFGFHNGSMQITGLKASDVGQYNVVILLRPKEILNASIDLRLATPPLATVTTATTATTTVTTAATGTSPIKEVPKEPSKLGWIVAGVLVGVLLCGALGAIMIYRFVLRKSEPGTGVTGKLDLAARMSPPSKHDDKEPIYEVVDSPVESPKDLPPISGPLPPLPGTCPKLDSNYTDLLYRAESCLL